MELTTVLFHILNIQWLVCLFYCVCVCLSLICVRLFVTQWTVACQTPLSVEFSRQEYWSGLPFTSPGDLPDPGIEPRSPALQEDSLLLRHLGSPMTPIHTYDAILRHLSEMHCGHMWLSGFSPSLAALLGLSGPGVGLVPDLSCWTVLWVTPFALAMALLLSSETDWEGGCAICVAKGPLLKN